MNVGPNEPQSDSAEDVIRRAIFDPGRYVAREDIDGSDAIHAWEARAVLVALDSMNGLQAIARTILDRHYPADLTIVCDRDSPDPGPRLTAALRDCLEAMEARNGA